MSAVQFTITSNSDLEASLGPITDTAERAAALLWQTLEDHAPNASPAERDQFVGLAAALLSQVLINDDLCFESPGAAHIQFEQALLGHLQLDARFSECDDIHDAATDAVRNIDSRLSRMGLRLRDPGVLAPAIAALLRDSCVVALEQEVQP